MRIILSGWLSESQLLLTEDAAAILSLRMLKATVHNAFLC